MTIALILLTKLNYIFALPVLLGIPIVYKPILSALKRCSRITRVLLTIVTSLLFFIVGLFVHRVYNIIDLIKVFSIITLMLRLWGEEVQLYFL